MLASRFKKNPQERRRPNKFVGQARKHDKKSKFLNEEENKEDGEWENSSWSIALLENPKIFSSKWRSVILLLSRN